MRQIYLVFHCFESQKTESHAHAVMPLHVHAHCSRQYSQSLQHVEQLLSPVRFHVILSHPSEAHLSLDLQGSWPPL